MQVTKKIFTREAAKKIFYQCNLSLPLKNYSNSTSLCWKTKSRIFYYLKGKNLWKKLVEFCLFVCVCVFFKQKIFSCTFDLCGRVGDKKNFHPTDFRKQDYFFWLKYSNKLLDKQRCLMQTYVTSQFNYCPLLWMFHSRKLNNRTSSIYTKEVWVLFTGITKLLLRSC